MLIQSRFRSKSVAESGRQWILDLFFISGQFVEVVFVLSCPPVKFDRSPGWEVAAAVEDGDHPHAWGAHTIPTTDAMNVGSVVIMLMTVPDPGDAEGAGTFPTYLCHFLFRVFYINCFQQHQIKVFIPCLVTEIPLDFETVMWSCT